MTVLTWLLIVLVVCFAYSLMVFLLGWYAGRASGILLASDEVRAVSAYNEFLTDLRTGKGAV